MIEVIIIVLLLFLLISPMEFYHKPDNKNWLALKRDTEERLSRYDGDNKDQVEMLVEEFGLCCEDIAVCRTLWSAKKKVINSKRATEISAQLVRLGLFEKTQKE